MENGISVRMFFDFGSDGMDVLFLDIPQTGRKEGKRRCLKEL